MSSQPASGIRVRRDASEGGVAAPGVATVTLDRPRVRNALTSEDFFRLGEVFEELGADPAVRVVVLAGAGDAFCAGADLTGDRGTAERLSRGHVARASFTRKVTAPALALHRLPKPTLAAVNGVAAGAGCNLALGCDLVFAAASARFAEVFVNRGLSIDYGGTWLLPRLIGLQRAKDLAFRGDVIDVEEARELGLVLEVVPDADLMTRVYAYAAMLAAKPPIALSNIKSGMNRLLDASFEEGLELESNDQAIALGSKDFRTAVRAFLKKEEGSYTGE